MFTYKKFVKKTTLNYNLAMKRFVYPVLSLLLFTTLSGTCAPVPTAPPAKPAEIKHEVKTNVNNDVKHDTKQEIKEEKQELPKTPATPDKLDAYQDIRDQAKLLYNANKPDEAQKLYSSIPDSEKLSEDWLIMANISQDKGKAVDAVFYLKKALQVDDKNYKAHYNLGNLYYLDNKVNMALDEYKKVLKIKKDFAYAYYNKGCCYLKKKSWYNARYEFGLAIKANPEEPSFYYNLAYTYKMWNKPKKAQEALDMYNKLMTQ